MVERNARDPLARAEAVMAQSPLAGLSILEQTAEDATLPADTRAIALAMIAMHVANQRTDRALAEGKAYLSRAEALRPTSAEARGRLALVRGYVAHRETRDALALEQLNEAVSLLDGFPQHKSRALDVLGMLLARRGDLDGAHAMFTSAAELKKANPGVVNRHSLAVTYGHLGRIELSRERFAEAESWLRKDLNLIVSQDPKPETEASVRTQLAQAINAQSKARTAEVKAELDRARKLAPPGSIVLLYVLKSVTQLALNEGRYDDARLVLEELREAARKHRSSEFTPWLALLEARARRTRAGAAPDSKSVQFLEEAWKGFTSRKMPLEACDAAIELAEAHQARGETRRAVSVLEQAKQQLDAPEPERQVLAAKLDARLAQSGGDGLMSVIQSRVRRMFGGFGDLRHSEQPPAASSKTADKPSTITVCVIELRGFDAFWSQSVSAAALLQRAARIVGALAAACADAGATIERVDATMLTLSFPGAMDVVRALNAFDRAQGRLAEVQAEHAHLGEPLLSLAGGIAVGWAKAQEIAGAVGAARPLLGPAVEHARQLAATASARHVQLDADAKAVLPATHLSGIIDGQDDAADWSRSL